MWHAGQCSRTTTPSQPKQDGLGLVLAGVCEQHGVGTESGGRLVEGGMSGIACRGLNTVPGLAHLDRHYLNRIKPETATLLGGPRRHSSGFCKQLMVDDERARQHSEFRGHLSGGRGQRE